MKRPSRSDTRASSRHRIASPVTGEPLGDVRVFTASELRSALSEVDAARSPWTESDALAFMRRLERELEGHRDLLMQTTQLETGFTTEHTAEIVDGAIEFLRDFELYARATTTAGTRVLHTYAGPSERVMTVLHRPYRWVAAMVPQNASLTLSITVIASAMYAGAGVLVRPSLQCGVGGELLSLLVDRARPPAGAVLIRNALAQEFLAAAYESDEVELVHYIGSNQHAMTVFVDAFEAKKVCLLDGQGNGLAYVDEGYAVDDAADIIVSGATRYNGETCTSINGVLAHPAVYDTLRDQLVGVMQGLRVGDPREPETEVGPLFSARQAQDLAQTLRAGSARRLCGGDAFGAYFSPAVAEGVAPDASLVREGVFGPAVWLQSAMPDDLRRWLRSNRFPLSDTVLTHRPELADAVARHSRAARICVNADPSVESMFEPWGGYPPSGFNPVSTWTDKYRQSYQLDTTASQPEPGA